MQYAVHTNISIIKLNHILVTETAEDCPAQGRVIDWVRFGQRICISSGTCIMSMLLIQDIIFIYRVSSLVYLHPLNFKKIFFVSNNLQEICL